MVCVWVVTQVLSRSVLRGMEMGWAEDIRWSRHNGSLVVCLEEGGMMLR